MLGPDSSAWALAAVFAAGTVQGLLGFGFSLVTVPVLVLLLAPRTAVPVILVLSTLINLFLYRGVRGKGDLKRIRLLMIAGTASLPVGTYLLASIDARPLKVLIGVVISFFALAFLAGWRRPVACEKAGLVATGVASGILNGVTSTSGPPVILFLANQGMTKDAFRASLVTYFLFLNLATLPIYLAAGLLSLGVMAQAGFLVPAMVVGALVGSRLTSRVPEKAFRILAMLMVLATGLMSTLSGAGLLWSR
jgi:uncharacterized membrane protein YfcA